MGPCAPVIPADPVTSSLNLLEDRPEAAESDRGGGSDDVCCWRWGDEGGWSVGGVQPQTG